MKSRETRDLELQLARSRKADREATTPRVADGRTKPPRQVDKGYLAWLRRLPCVAGAVEGAATCDGPIQAAHLRFSDAARGRTNPGMMRRPDDRFACSLCEKHHIRDQHAGSERAFWARLGIDPGELTDALYAAFLADQDGAAVIQQFARRSTP